MFIEYRGTFVCLECLKSLECLECLKSLACPESLSCDVETMWLSAMNKDVPNAIHLIKLYQTAKLYGCSFDSRHDKSVATLNLININNQTAAP